VIFDVSGLQRVLGPPAVIAVEVARLSAAYGLVARVAVAGTMTAAWLLAHARSGVTVVPAGEEAASLAELGIETLEALACEGLRPQASGFRKDAATKLSPRPDFDILAILQRWGLRTLGDFAKLPEADVRTRLGEAGARLHRAARGLDAAPLVPAAEPARFCERIELEWPIEGLEPLSFVVGRLCESLATVLERADRGAVAITTRLRLVTRATHERTLSLPAPIREARVLRTLILLDLESHPPPAAIDVVEIDLGVTPARIVQGSLLTRTLPSPDTLATLVARLSALMGDTRVGAPALVDSHDERAVEMKAFDPGVGPRASGLRNTSSPSLQAQEAPKPLRPVLRRFRLPVAAEVVVEHGAPVHVRPSTRGLPGGRVVTRAGPFRSSGRWWPASVRTADFCEASPKPGEGGARRGFDRDEWEVELEGAAGGVDRLARDRATGRWEIEGEFD
jgi:protein ImuB